MGFLDDIIDPERAYLTIDQNTEEWQRMRLGRFTASEIHKLMAPAKREMTAKEQEEARKRGSRAKLIEDPSRLSDTAVTYVLDKVAETLTGEFQESFSYALSHGKNMEPMARTHFAEVTGLEVQDAVFVPFLTIAGGSPDGLVGEDAILEIKCPFEPRNQVRYLSLNTQMDLFAEFPEYWYQCQANMLFTKRDKAYFATYDPRFKEDKHKMKIIELTADKDDQKRILEKIDAAQKLKDEIIKELTGG